MINRLSHESVSRKTQYLLLAGMPVFFIVAGCFLQPLETIIPGIWTLMIEPDFLITDYFVVGGIGSAFINAGLLTLMCVGLAYAFGLEVEGHTVTSAYLMFGFALFGKNLMNVWAILLGTFLYSWTHKIPLSKYLYVGFYGTALSPIITQMIHLPGLSPIVKLFLGILVGITMGFVLPPLSVHVQSAHKGYSLYNVGFACGIIATVVVSVLRSFGVAIGYRSFWYTGGNTVLAIVLYTFFIGMMLICVLVEKSRTFKCFIDILKTSGLGGTDYIKDKSFFVAGFNMGLNGIVGTTFVLLVGGQLNGPTIGGIMTIVGFGTTGKHLRNILPVMIGVLLGCFLSSRSITDPVPMLALLFCTTLAPIAGKFGIIAGIIAGVLHYAVVMNVGSVYAGMNLYNNGFAGGLVAILLVPLLQSFHHRFTNDEQ